MFFKLAKKVVVMGERLFWDGFYNLRSGFRVPNFQKFVLLSKLLHLIMICEQIKGFTNLASLILINGFSLQ